MDGLCLKTGLMTSQIIVSDVRSTPAKIPAAVGRSPANGSASKWRFSMKHPFKSLWPVGRKRFEAVSQNDVVSVEEDDEDEDSEGGGGERRDGRDGNWVLKILQLRALREREERNENGEKSDDFDAKSDDFDEKSDEFDERSGGYDEGSECFGEECGVCGEGEEGNVVVDKRLFSKMLRRVNLGEARLYAQLSYLGSLAYSIPRIEPGNLLKYHGFHFVTSSVEKQEQALKAEKEKVSKEIQEKEKGSADSQKKEKGSADSQKRERGSADSQKKEKGSADSPKKEKVSAEVLAKENDIAEKSDEKEATGAEKTEGNPEDMAEADEEKERENQLSAYIAYRIAASAASYLLYHTTNLLPFRSSDAEVREDLSKDSVGDVSMLNNVDMMNGDVASLIATTDSVTSVVAAKEEVKQAVADDLNSTSSTPCEWFVCDDDQTTTRFFVIQGSESLASWQANLLFEPVKFEGLDVLVHRGIYEAAKGIYEQMLPEVRSHVKNHGDHAMFRFTGHSLGGSLSMLVNLMLLIRGDVPPSLLLPVVTFGAPAIMCGGDRLLQKLGLPKSHVQSICMHRDIVPRAFSCNYPTHVTELLKAVNGKFRGHPCLEDNGLLYFPMGEFLILQPDANFSPHHELLPSGSGLYLLTCPTSDGSEGEKNIRAAQVAFLNTPHPLEILSDRSSYGSEGAILRDHDMTSYLKTIQNFIRQELNQVRKTRRKHRRRFMWPLVAGSNINEDIAVGSPVASSTSSNTEQFNFAGVLHTGRESFRRLTKLLTSRHMHVVILFLFPARILILGAYNMINFH